MLNFVSCLKSYHSVFRVLNNNAETKTYNTLYKHLHKNLLAFDNIKQIPKDAPIFKLSDKLFQKNG